MLAEGNKTIDSTALFEHINEMQILYYYFHVDKIPCIINSPLRIDKHPSFCFYINSKGSIGYKDYATGECGTLLRLLGIYYKLDYNQMLVKLWEDKDNIARFSSGNNNIIKEKQFTSAYNDSIAKLKDNIKIDVVTRNWEPHDIEYWESYGISLKWLKYAEVYPIKYKIITKNGYTSYFKADKYAYCYVERKENNISLKIYQPFNKQYKWCSTMDKSTISLWTKVPQKAEKLCICSSLKDALCLWANVGIPSIAVPGEAFKISATALQSLRSRYNNIYILLDNDPPGLKDGQKLAKETGFTNIVLPAFEDGKDISDMRKLKGREYFIKTIRHLFN